MSYAPARVPVAATAATAATATAAAAANAAATAATATAISEMVQLLNLRPSEDSNSDAWEGWCSYASDNVSEGTLRQTAIVSNYFTACPSFVGPSPGSATSGARCLPWLFGRLQGCFRHRIRTNRPRRFY